mgnify:FL=1|jgi:hypothetical protein
MRFSSKSLRTLDPVIFITSKPRHFLCGSHTNVDPRPKRPDLYGSNVGSDVAMAIGFMQHLGGVPTNGWRTFGFFVTTNGQPWIISILVFGFNAGFRFAGVQ